MLILEQKNSVHNKIKQLTEPDSTSLRTGTSKLQRPPFHWIIVREVMLMGENIEDVSMEIRKISCQLVRSLAALQDYIHLLVKSDETGKVNVCIGVGGPSRSVVELEGIVRSVFPGIITDNIKSGNFSNEDYRIGTYMMGIPRTFSEDNKAWLTSILRGLQGKSFTILLVAAPLPSHSLQECQETLFQERDQVFSLKKRSRSESIATMVQSTESYNDNHSDGFLKNISGGDVGRTVGSSSTNSETRTEQESLEFEVSSVSTYIDYLDHHINRIETGHSEGMWQTAVYIAADKMEQINVIKASASGTLLDAESFSHPLVFKEHPAVLQLMKECFLPEDEKTEHLLNGRMSGATSILTTSELASLMVLPEQEFYGYGLRKVINLSSNPTGEKGSLHIGQLYQREQLCNYNLSINPEQLTKHALITGLTGSGKTNTIFSLLGSVQVPFLVIEPTKREYRHLLSKKENLRIYTLGNEIVSPIRLNPFYFPEGVSLISHIDSLKAVFTSAFSMYASMPNILEQCLYNIYVKRGWSLHYSTNIYVNSHKEAEEYFPTIKDLYDEIDEYLTKSGYAEEQMSNIRAALLTRLKSLMVGSKGLLLNTNECLDFDELLKFPTVLELEDIADEEDKALIMGLLFIRISQQLKLNREEGKIDIPLKHITIIEEAHRVFSNQSSSPLSPETANIKGKAVEYFCNMLSEIRSMGEGILIIDQIPGKLASDAIKNTNLKIVHRLVSVDDIEYMTNSLAMNEKESYILPRLKRGQAIVFQEGMDKPVHLQINAVKETVRFVYEDELKIHVKKYNSFLNKIRDIHPFAEIMVEQDEFAQKKVLLIGQRLYNSLMFANLTEIYSYINDAKEQLIKIAYQVGLDINEQSKRYFAQSILKMTMQKIIDSNRFFGKINHIRSKIKHYIFLLLDNEDYCWSDKELHILQIRREDTLYPLLQEAYQRLLSDDRLAHHLLKKPSPVDGEAYISSYTIANQHGILKRNDFTDDPKTNIEKFFLSVKDAVNQFFMESLKNSELYFVFLEKVLFLLTIEAKNESLNEYLSILVKRERGKS